MGRGPGKCQPVRQPFGEGPLAPDCTSTSPRPVPEERGLLRRVFWTRSFDCYLLGAFPTHSAPHPPHATPRVPPLLHAWLWADCPSAALCPSPTTTALHSEHDGDLALSASLSPYPGPHWALPFL